MRDRAAERGAELIQPQRSFAAEEVVEEVGRVNRVISQILKDRPVKLVRARPGDDAHLPARAAAQLRRKAARIDAEFLHVLQTGLEPEGGGNLAVETARTRIEDSRPLDAVVANHVLFVGPPVESNVPERARTRIHGARGLKVKL